MDCFLSQSPPGLGVSGRRPVPKPARETTLGQSPRGGSEGEGAPSPRPCIVYFCVCVCVGISCLLLGMILAIWAACRRVRLNGICVFCSLRIAELPALCASGMLVHDASQSFFLLSGFGRWIPHFACHAGPFLCFLVFAISVVHRILCS